MLSISVSGGKDSQALALRLCDLRQLYGWTGHAEVVHADLGRAEWPQTPGHVERIAADADLPLVIVRRAKGDLVQRIEERAQTVASGPAWPSAAMRYCTSDLKRGPIQKRLRQHGGTALVIDAIGLRADESAARARRAPVEISRAVTGKAYHSMTPAEALAQHLKRPKGRLVLSWYPLLDWSEGHVWSQVGTSTYALEGRRERYRTGDTQRALAGWPAHPAYVMGNSRLACALCVLASRADLENGVRHNRALAEHYAALEKRSGYTFRQDLSITELLAEVAE